MRNKRFVPVFVVLVSLFFAASCYKSEQQAPPQTPHISTGIFPDWEVVEDVEQTSNLDIAKMKFKSFLKNGESYIGGDEMRERAVALKCNLGLSDAEYLLEHQSEIPTELRGKYIVLPGTVLRNSTRNLCVVILRWRGGRWELDWYWLGYGFGAYGRLACSE